MLNDDKLTKNRVLAENMNAQGDTYFDSVHHRTCLKVNNATSPTHRSKRTKSHVVKLLPGLSISPILTLNKDKLVMQSFKIHSEAMLAFCIQSRHWIEPGRLNALSQGQILYLLEFFYEKTIRNLPLGLNFCFC